MRFFQRQEREIVEHTGQPKTDRDDPLQQEMDEINRLQREIYKALRMKGEAALQSRILLDEEKCKRLRRVRKEYGALPIISTKTGYWYIYE
jgi:hypothetical protein